MPVEDQKAGNCYVWLVYFFLFFCTMAGGFFLFLFILQPDSPETSWYPFTGVGLVCLPWFFWVLTLGYRIISRACGFRMVCFGVGGGSVYPDSGSGTTADNGGGEVKVEAGTAGEVGVEEGRGSGASSRSSHSNESEMPLKLSMAS